MELSAETIRAAADPKSYQRGRDYFAAGEVRKLQVSGKTAKAKVAGSAMYRVELALGKRGLDGSCMCPHGQGGAFCKHCVAVALAWLDGRGEAAAPVAEPVAEPVADRTLTDFLKST